MLNGERIYIIFILMWDETFSKNENVTFFVGQTKKWKCDIYNGMDGVTGKYVPHFTNFF